MASEYESDAEYGTRKKQIQDYASQKGVTYDDSDVDDVYRNNGDINVAFRKMDERAKGNGGPQQQGGNATTQAWNNQGSSSGSGAPDWMRAYLERTEASSNAAATENKARADALYATLMQRSQQAQAVGRNDPNVRPVVDAYAANEERSKRNYLADVAEESGPYANMRGETRLASERVGQRTGAFEAEAMGRELSSRREEIAQALSGMAGLLSRDQDAQLRRELTLIDTAMAQQGINLQSRGLDQDWRRALMQNDQFTADLGLRAEDRATYYDLVRRGLI